jgi:hypothetical protein
MNLVLIFVSELGLNNSYYKAAGISRYIDVSSCLYMHINRCRLSSLGLGGGVMFRRKLKASRRFLYSTVVNTQLPEVSLVAFLLL